MEARKFILEAALDAAESFRKIFTCIIATNSRLLRTAKEMGGLLKDQEKALFLANFSAGSRRPSG